jgi:CHASE2 domain-containing sensor protein
MTVTKFSDWPSWLQFLVVFPNALLGFIMTWVWWPKSGKSFVRFGILAAYLLAFYLVMHFVFKA